MDPILLWTLVIVLFLVGLAGTLIPALPGIAFVFAGIALFAFATGFAEVTIPMLVVFGVASVLIWLADYTASAFGAKIAGGGKFAVFGALLGTLVGLFIGPFGMLAGAFLGGLLGALRDGQTQQQAIKVAFVTIISTLGASVFQLIMGLAMILVFFVLVFT